jgi:hypothetical protein
MTPSARRTQLDCGDPRARGAGNRARDGGTRLAGKRAMQRARRAILFGAVALASACSGAQGTTAGDDGDAAPQPAGEAGIGATADAGAGPLVDSGVDAPSTGNPPDAGSDAPAAGDAGHLGEWSSVSFGITGADTGVGDAILVAYGGYTATDHDSQAWATALWSARLAELGVGHLYAARGPADAGYNGREIGNSTLATRLASQAAPASAIVVVAHSSGAFVADELFTFADPAVLAKIVYFDLDGGSWALTDALIGKMKAVMFTNAHDPVAGDSHNAQAIVSLHAQFAASLFFTVDASGSGCNVGATWCLHDTLITNRPHDPTTYDLADDYTDFTAGRRVITSYIDHAVSAGVL